jgi:hypothetical protein
MLRVTGFDGTRQNGINMLRISGFGQAQQTLFSCRRGRKKLTIRKIPKKPALFRATAPK